MRQDKRYRNGEIHKVILGILELISADEDNARQYRNELASILF
jgi:thioredoxin-like negative regulator of GroEL